MKKILYSIVIMSLVSLAACEKYEAGGTATKDLAGDWWVTYEIDFGEGWEDVNGGHSLLTTYNTAANIREIFVDDNANFWEFKAKVPAQNGKPAFGSTDELKNYYYDSKVKIFDGVVLPELGLSKTGVVTDSICLFVAFNDEEDAFGGDGTAYATKVRVSGHRRTGFSEDEY